MITIKDMSFGYTKESLFEDLTLEITPGSIYGLLGLNGAGKTTLMRLISGLLFSKSGTISVLGDNPARRNPNLLSRVFFLPEDPLLPSVREGLFVSSRSAFYPRFNHAEFDQYLQTLEVPRKQMLNQLSHGQQKKFLLAFGLASGSELVIMDEPSNGLDIPSKGLFRRLVAETLTDERAFIISTHQVKDVDSLIDPIIIIHQGRVLFEHSLAEIANCIHMTRSPGPPSPEDEGLLHNEAVVGGYGSVWAGAGEGFLDLELLFNAAISHPERIHAVFQKMELSR